MIYSRAVEYAIRALTYLAQRPEGAQMMARQIAQEEDIPSFFLAKTLQQLARKGVLRSTKGPTGGFGLNRPANKISLMDIVDVLDGPETLERWPTHRSFNPLRRELIRYLTKTTVADLAKTPTKKKYPMTTGKPPRKPVRKGRS